MPTGKIDGINFFHLPGHPHNTMCLEEAGVAQADAIIIGPADDLNSKEVRLAGGRGGQRWLTGCCCSILVVPPATSEFREVEVERDLLI